VIDNDLCELEAAISQANSAGPSLKLRVKGPSMSNVTAGGRETVPEGVESGKCHMCGFIDCI
jgi:hypothetical protein